MASMRKQEKELWVCKEHPQGKVRYGSVLVQKDENQAPERYQQNNERMTSVR